jgi:hypothetical protein
MRKESDTGVAPVLAEGKGGGGAIFSDSKITSSIIYLCSTIMLAIYKPNKTRLKKKVGTQSPTLEA